MDHNQVCKALREFLIKECDDGGAWCRQNDDFIDGRVNISKMVNVILSIAAQEVDDNPQATHTGYGSLIRGLMS